MREAIGVLAAAALTVILMMLAAMALSAYVWPLMAPGTCP